MKGRPSKRGAPTGPARFLVSWNGGRLVYEPALGRIEDLGSGHSFRLHHRTTVPDSPAGDRGTRSEADPVAFRPLCLSVFPGHRCALACPYCYAQEKNGLPEAGYRPDVLRPAVEFVADTCARAGQPFTLAFLGACEPLLYRGFVQSVCEGCREAASQRNLELHTICTTHGVVGLETARWAARYFSRLTLSWDGPPRIHDGMRRTSAGGPTSQIVQRNAAVFSASCRDFRVRMTVTAENAPRILDSVRYFHSRRIRHVACFPVSQNAHGTVPVTLVPEPAVFVHHFLRARRWAHGRGLHVTYAGSRLGDPHGTFCYPLQRNLAITPDGFLTACFLATHSVGVSNAPFTYGRIDPDGLHVDPVRLHTLLSRATGFDPACAACFNRMHCARTCPTACPLRPAGAAPIDCTIERWIGLANLLEAAGYEISDDDLEDCERFFSSIDVSPIGSSTRMTQYRLTTELYTLPYRNGQVILYAPLIGFVGAADGSTERVLASLEAGGDPSHDPACRKVLDVLVRAGVVNGTPVVQPVPTRTDPPSPSKLALFPTSACNLRCRYCYAYAVGSDVLTMDWDVATNAVEYFLKLMRRETRTVFPLEFFGGGEPLYAWSLVQQIVAYAEKRCADEGYRLQVSATTNGVLNDRQRAWITAHFACLNVSFDVLPDVQNVQRAAANGKPTFEVVDETLRYFDRHNFPYAIRCTVSTENEDRLEETVEFVLAHYRTHLLFLEPVTDSGCGPREIAGMTPDLVRFAESFERLDPRCARKGLRLACSGAHLDRIAATFCYVGSDDFAVTPDGYLTNCWAVARGDHPLADPFLFGRLLPNGEISVDPDRLTRLRALTVQHLPTCKFCFAKWHCAGGCPVKLGHRDYHGPRDAARCALTRRLLTRQIVRTLEEETIYGHP